jgi:hypothetical protein
VERAGERMGPRLSRIELFTPIFTYKGALEDVVTKWVDLLAAWAKWCVSCGVKWEAKFAFQADIEDPWWHPVGWLAAAERDDGGQRVC